MKKKFTVGVFLALAVVLVASIVGVGAADAAKPDRKVDLTTAGVTEFDINYTYYWQDWGARGVEVTLYKYDGATYVRTVSSITEMFESRRTDGTKPAQVIAHEGCGYDYILQVCLLKKNGSRMRGACDGVRVTPPCD